MDNLTVYRNAETVAHYVGYTTLQPVETHLFDRFIVQGSDILDLGVGGGRTTPYLSARAQRYLGVDYSAEMVEACRARFPRLAFEVMDAADLLTIPAASFDVVVFSFNGLGCLQSDSARAACLAEVRRVLRPGGVFIFSLHNARSIFERPRRHGNIVRSIVKSALANLARIAARATGRAFWIGAGYIATEAHGGLTVFATVPERLIADGFAHVVTINEDFPRDDHRLLTRWYYYVLRRH